MRALTLGAVVWFVMGAVANAETQMTFALKKGAGGWLIHGWTWTGPKARPAASAAKP